MAFTFTFTSSGLFVRATKDAISKSNFAGIKIREILNKLGTDAPETRNKLYASMVKSVLLYGSEVWALRSELSLEKAQTNFFKNHYYLPRATPGYCIRTEFGLNMLITEVFQRALRWYNKIAVMDDTRLPRKLLKYQLSTHSETDTKNWSGCLKTMFQKSSKSSLWSRIESLSPLNNEEVDSLVNGYTSYLRQIDLSRLAVSSFCAVFKALFDRAGISNPVFNGPMSLQRARLLCRLKMLNQVSSSFSLSGTVHRFYPSRPCQICNSKDPDTFEHCLLSCTALNGCRPDKIKLICQRPPTVPDADILADLLSVSSRVDLDCLLSFVSAALRSREFGLDP